MPAKHANPREILNWNFGFGAFLELGAWDLELSFGYHLKVAYPDSSYFFLQKNVYTNGITTVDPFFDAAPSPVHIMH